MELSKKESSWKSGFIPLSTPEIKGSEWAFIKDCLDTNWISSAGPYVERFERVVANYVNRRYGVATASGTAALHTALMIAGIQANDEIILPALTFAAPANAVIYVGAKPVFIDVEREYCQLDAQKLCDFLDRECEWKNGVLYNRRSGRPIRAIIPVHVLGHPVDMDPILKAAEKYNLTIVEDAAESLGALYRNRHTGNFGRISCFSFNGNKTITTGAGGMILTDDNELAERARYLTTQAKDDPVEYIHNDIGYNYRLSNILAAMGVAQMENVDSFIEKKRRIAAKYTKAFQKIEGISTPREADWAFSTFWLYTIRIDEKKIGLDSRTLLRRLDSEGIQSRPLWMPLPRNLPFRDCVAYEVEVADELHADSLSIPCSVGLTEEQQERVIQAISEICSSDRS